MKKPLQTVMIVDDMAVNLSLINQDPPDIILLDIVMPDMDGYELCLKLKSQPLTRAIPIIFLTAKNSIQDEEHGLTLGAVDFIHKPISPQLTLARIQTHLELKRLKAWQQEQMQIESITN